MDDLDDFAPLPGHVPDVKVASSKKDVSATSERSKSAKANNKKAATM